MTIAITARATTVGSHTNTATVTGGGGRETNPADNVDSAVTVVPAPLKPPMVKPSRAGRLPHADRLAEDDQGRRQAGPGLGEVAAAAKRVKGVKVVVAGAGVNTAGQTNGKGVAVLRINPKKPGIITITASRPTRRSAAPSGSGSWGSSSRRSRASGEGALRKG